jgi:fermentation-respiration switch protein FrsA (DUF1100 family)
MRRDITFDSQGSRCAGWLYLPDDLPAGRKAPGIVMANAISAVKEMYLANYAERFAAAGFAALVFDYRYFGESEGEPRGQLFPNEQLDDIKNAISWFSLQPEVDAERLGGWGISFGGAHLVFITAFEKRLEALVATVPSAVANIEVLERGIGPQGALGFLGFLTGDRAMRYQSGAVNEIKVTAQGPEPSMVPGPLAYDFYTTAQQTIAPTWRNAVTIESVEKMMEYNPVWPVHRIAPTPLRVVLAENDEFIPSDLVRATFERAGEPKDLVVLSCGHLEVYDTEPWLTRAADAAIDWFTRYL